MLCTCLSPSHLSAARPQPPWFRRSSLLRGKDRSLRKIWKASMNQHEICRISWNRWNHYCSANVPMPKLNWRCNCFFAVVGYPNALCWGNELASTIVKLKVVTQRIHANPLKPCEGNWFSDHRLLALWQNVKLGSQKTLEWRHVTTGCRDVQQVNSIISSFDSISLTLWPLHTRHGGCLAKLVR